MARAHPGSQIFRTALCAGRASVAVALMVGLVLATGCETTAADPGVHFGQAPALGTWASTATGPAAADPAGVVGAAAGSPPAAAGSSGGADTGGTAPGATPQAGQGVQPDRGGIGGAELGGTGGGDALGGQAGSGGVDVMMMPDLGLGGLQFSVLTKTLNGKYSPKNIGAIWIETSSGAFVKTLEVWANKRVRHLSRWRAEASSNKVDAVASATLRSHVAHDASWDLSDVNGAPVMPGDYKVVVEMTDHDGPGDSIEVPFTLSDPLMVSPPDQAHFVGMALAVE